MDFDHIVVKESPGLCRCCLSEGCYKDLGTEYPWMDDTEVYADMFLECFDISISQHNEGPNGPKRLICEVCITRLRDACNFKKQVLDSEKKFVDMVGRGEFRPKATTVTYQSPMKCEISVEALPSDAEEVEFLDEGDHYDDDSFKDESTSTAMEVTATPLPAKGKRGRPKKSSTVKPEKKPKVPKLEEKPKTSKAVSKGFQIFSRLEDEDCQANRKRAFRNLLTTVLETSTIMPFRWFCNKYMCFYCCASFVDSFNLKQHTKEEHVDPKLRNVLRRRDLGYTRIKLDVSETNCKRCLKRFHNFQGFLDHCVDEHDVVYEKDLLQYLISCKLSDEGMSCEDCGEGFRFFGTLLTHMHKCHNRVNTFLCEVCGKGFIAKSTLDCHVRTLHSTTESQKCQKCNRIFPSQYALSNHYSKTHKYETFKCSKCPEVFKSRYLKKRHLAMVHDVKSSQFSCSDCDKMFTVKSALVQHVSRVHLKEKLFACEICGFKVFSKDLLKRHMVKHDDSRPFQCEFCKKSFQRKKTLDFHRRIHTNDKRYICKDCGKAFVQVASLKLHIRVHHSFGNDST